MTVARMLDTSTLSHFFGSRAREKTPELLKYVNEIIATDGARISVVTWYELERGLRKLELGGQGRAKRRKFRMLLSATSVYSLDGEDGRGWMIAADLHARASTTSPAIKFDEGDLLILATALVHGMKLLTSDVQLVQNAAVLGHAEHVEFVVLA